MAQGIDFLEQLKKELELKEVDIRTYSPLSLAYIGDAVYDMMIRSYLVLKGNTSNNKLHNSAVKYVSAKSQAKIIDTIINELSEEELSVYRRGKNSKPSSSAKNATLAEYMRATGFEALIGYLYLKEDEDRLIYIIKRGISIINE